MIGCCWSAGVGEWLKIILQYKGPTFVFNFTKKTSVHVTHIYRPQCYSKTMGGFDKMQ